MIVNKMIINETSLAGLRRGWEKEVGVCLLQEGPHYKQLKFWKGNKFLYNQGTCICYRPYHNETRCQYTNTDEPHFGSVRMLLVFCFFKQQEKKNQIKSSFTGTSVRPSLWRGSQSWVWLHEKVRDQCCTEGGLGVLNNTVDDVMGATWSLLPWCLHASVLFQSGRTGIVHLC